MAAAFPSHPLLSSEPIENTHSPDVKANSPQLMFPCAASQYKAKVTVSEDGILPQTRRVLIKPDT